MDITNTLIIALVCVAMGYLAGLMISNMRRESEQKSKPEPVQNHTVTQPDLAYLQVAHLVRDTTTGPLIINLEGHYYHSPVDLTPDQHSQVEELTVELQEWLGYAPKPAHEKTDEYLGGSEYQPGLAPDDSIAGLRADFLDAPVKNGQPAVFEMDDSLQGGPFSADKGWPSESGVAGVEPFTIQDTSAEFDIEPGKPTAAAAPFAGRAQESPVSQAAPSVVSPAAAPGAVISALPNKPAPAPAAAAPVRTGSLPATAEPLIASPLSPASAPVNTVPQPMPATPVKAGVQPMPAVPLKSGPLAQPAAVQPVPLASIKTDPLVQPAVLQSTPVVKRAPLSIVEQIDEILQKNIAGTEFGERGVRLVETPNRGVGVRIGLELFQLDEVPEAEIRGLIRAAVAEWELLAK